MHKYLYLWCFRMNNKKTVTLSINEKIYEEYKKYCEENGLILSKQVEMFMKEQLKRCTK